MPLASKEPTNLNVDLALLQRPGREASRGLRARVDSGQIVEKEKLRTVNHDGCSSVRAALRGLRLVLHNRLRSTGQTVRDPDFLLTWTITRGTGADPEEGAGAR